MTKRLNAIVNRITEKNVVLDIGCDMALVGEMLAKKGIHSYASDVVADIIKRAGERLEKLGLKKSVTLVVSDGLKSASDIDADTLVISGMGTFTILEILKHAKKSYDRIITISNNNYETLREKMLSIGYIIKEEEIIFEKNKFYNLIEFTPGKEEYTKEELIIGKNHKNIELLKKRNEYLISKYNKIFEKSKREELKELIDILKGYKY